MMLPLQETSNYETLIVNMRPNRNPDVNYKILKIRDPDDY